MSDSGIMAGMEISLPYVLPAHTALAIREQVPVAEIAAFYERTYAVLDRVMGHARVQPVAVRGYYLSPPGATFDVAAAFVIPEFARQIVADVVDGVPGFTKEGVMLMDFPETRAVKTELSGDYAQLGPAWEEFCAKIVRDGYVPGSWTCEDYLTMPGSGDPDLLRTDLISSIR